MSAASSDKLIETGNGHVKTKDETQTPRTMTFSSLAECHGVNVQVEGDKRQFLIHKDVLCTQSGYFKSRFNFTEACTLNDVNGPSELGKAEGKSSITLQHINDADAFALVVDWLYRGKAVLSAIEKGGSDNYVLMREAQVILTRMYIVADKLVIPKLKNEIADEVVTFSHETLPSMQALCMLREGIPIQSPLENYLQESLVNWLHRNPSYLRNSPNNWHLEASQYFKGDTDLLWSIFDGVCARNSGSNGGQSLTTLPTQPHCKYHDHGQGAPQHDCAVYPGMNEIL